MTHTTDTISLRDAVAKLIKAKGRFHTEKNYAELVRAFDATEAAPVAAIQPAGEAGELEFEQRQFLKHWAGLDSDPGKWPVHYGHAWTGWLAYQRAAIAAGKLGNSAMPAAFGDWFKQNYPANTLIHDPEWHAPKIYWRAIHAASAPAKPEAKGDDVLRKALESLRDGRIGPPDTVTFINAALAAPVPAAPADKGELPDAGYCGYCKLPWGGAEQQACPDFISCHQRTLSDADQVIADRARQAAIVQPNSTAPNESLAYIRKIVDDELRVAIAQPSGAVESIDDAEFRKLADAYHCCNDQSKMEEIYYAMVQHVDNHLHAEVSRLAAAPQPPSTGIGHWHDGSPPVDWTPEAVAELHAVLDEYPPEPRASSIADDVEFRQIFGTLFDDGDATQFHPRMRAVFAYIDTRTAALIAASKEQSGDALDAERYRFLRHADLDSLAAFYYPAKEVPEGEELDKIIDQAIATTKAAQ